MAYTPHQNFSPVPEHNPEPLCRSSSMVELLTSNQGVRVRFPSAVLEAGACGVDAADHRLNEPGDRPRLLTIQCPLAQLAERATVNR